MSPQPLSELEDRLKDAEDELSNAVGAGTYKLGLQIAGDAHERGEPHDTGFLLNSLYVSPPKRRGGGITVTIGAGALYAAAAHELHFPFLKVALEALQEKIGEIMESFVSTAIEKGQVIEPGGEWPKTAGGGRARAASETGGD